ncbi:SDR family oxidoreductase [Chitiniphilus purpureus]|uniref:SDR family oxidoreductase n=1 Tax=Chitiniphilus purpureus TaxID=2981137 RepID=A0ABY6DK06_9NEIS|nr:SDR family oxidoreductase [Chitiniphilus sp. CD1]UXY14695.1 SDR family oxidoreductase [Chitiniphilus sp. CD1]
MVLKDKQAVVYGGGGVLGGAIARAFAAAGAHVFLAGRSLPKLEAVAADIARTGGHAKVAQVDALDEPATATHAADIAACTGRIDIAVNAIGVDHVQGTPLSALSLADFCLPVDTYIRSHFLIAKAVAPWMTVRGAAILALSTPAGQLLGPGYLGHCVACAGVEALTRHLAGELGERGIRALCIRSHAIPEAATQGSHSREVFSRDCAAQGITLDAMLAAAAHGTPLKRLPTLAQLAQTAVFLASEEAGAMTGAIVNMSCGLVPD